MAGLDYGNSFRISKTLPEGVHYNERSKKWIVRLTGYNNIICSFGAYKTKEEAESIFLSHKNKLTKWHS